MKISFGLTVLLVFHRSVSAFVPVKRGTRTSFRITRNAQQTPEFAEEIANNMISLFDPINENLSTAFSEIITGALDSLTSTLVLFQSTLESVDAPVLQALHEISTNLQSAIQAYLLEHPSYQPYYKSITDQIKTFSLDGTSPSLIILASTVVTYVVVSSILSLGQMPPPLQPYPLQRYDASSARAYFDRRLPKVIARGLEIATTSLGFGLALLRDFYK